MSAAVAIPRTLEEALDARAALPEALVVAGGSDLLPALRTGRRAQPEAWLLLHAVAPLAGIAPLPGGGLRIGATTTLATLARDGRVRAAAGALAEAAALVGGPATRTVATVAGNLVNGSPAMELGAPLLALGAIVELAAADGPPRRLPLERFLLGPGRVDLRPGELVRAIELPPAGGARGEAAGGDAAGGAGGDAAGSAGAALADGAGADAAGTAAGDGALTGSAYMRVGGRAAMEVALAGAAAAVTLAPGGATIAAARLALCAVAPTCVRARAAEALLRGAPATAEALDAAARAAAEVAAPIDDHRAPADYRAAVAEVAARRALDIALARAAAASAPTPPERTSSLPPSSAPTLPAPPAPATGAPER